MTTNLRVSVEQAAQTALADYLQAEMDREYGGGPERCVVSDAWPEPDSGLPRRAVSIIPAGDCDELHIQEQDIRHEDLGPGTEQKLYTWRVAACRQPIQLDVWSNYASHRDDLLARLTDSLHKGERFTLPNRPNGNVVRDGVLLALDPSKSGFHGYCDCVFEGPKKLDTSRAPRIREYRASILGYIDVDLTVKAPSARIARVLLKVALDPAADTDAATSPDITFALNTTTGAVAVTEGTL